jgi:prepilin-type N-terminal cleavage/methylation domain-containing protein
VAILSRSRRRGFTLIELLVVIAIIGILVGLMLPAVQAARESGRRTACQSNLRQWGLAFHQHADLTEVFPWGYHRSTPVGTFVPHLLPYIEQTNLRYETTRNWDDPVNLTAIRSELPILICPSTPGEHRFDDAWPAQLPAAGDYAGTGGVNPGYCQMVGWPLYSPQENNGILVDRECPLAWVKDGLSNTFLLLEDAGRPQLWRMGRLASGRSQNCGWADPDYSIALDGSDTLFSGSGQAGGPCVMNCTNDNEAYSFHRGICLSLIADGSVRTLYEGIDNRTFAALSTRASGEVVSE